MLKGVSFSPPVTEIIISDTPTTLNGPSHRLVFSQYIPTSSPGRIRYLAAGEVCVAKLFVYVHVLKCFAI